MQEFFSWNMLASFSGAVLATALITQMVKGIGFIDKLPTRVVSYVIAVVLLFGAAFFTGTLCWDSAVLCLINGAVVALAAQGGYEVVSTGLRKKVE